MPNWENSDRRSRLPADWPAIRRRILKRDGYRCVLVEDGLRCIGVGTDVDHIIPNDNHADINLQTLCAFHHRKKSGAEGGAAYRAKVARNKRRMRRQERHPGLL